MKDPYRFAFVRCTHCNGLVHPGMVERAIGPSGYKQVVQYLHPTCGGEGSHVMAWKEYIRMVNRWNDAVRKSKMSYDTEEVGRLVQGFRIDLDAVETVADIALLWDDQERRNRWSIPKEAAVA